MHPPSTDIYTLSLHDALPISHAFNCWWPVRARNSLARRAVHADRRAAHLASYRLWIHRLRDAGMVAPGAARLPLDIPQDRYRGQPGNRRPHHLAGAENAGTDTVRGRLGAGLVRQ